MAWYLMGPRLPSVLQLPNPSTQHSLSYSLLLVILLYLSFSHLFYFRFLGWSSSSFSIHGEKGAIQEMIFIIYYRKDIGSLEAFQRRMTKMIQGLRNLLYKDRLKHLNLHFLERKTARGDMIEVFK